MNLIPLKSRVLGRMVELDNTFADSSIIAVPGREKQKVPYLMRVIALGPDVTEVIEVGDIVILPEYGGAHVMVFDDETRENEKLFIIDEEHILGRWRDDAS